MIAWCRALGLVAIATPDPSPFVVTAGWFWLLFELLARIRQGDLGAIDHRQARLERRHMHAGGAVKTMVVGDGQGFVFEFDCPSDQILCPGRAVTEAEIGMAVKLGVTHLRNLIERVFD